MTEQTLRLRPGQEKILRYQSGMMGISAVPGSGKTWTLSLLAAELIKRGAVNPDQEILIVTLVNSAVDNFSSRIATQLQSANLLGLGYRVRTLHGLANDIVRERPELAGLSPDFQIIDEMEATRIIQNAAGSFLSSHPDFFEPFLDYDPSKRDSIYKDPQKLPRMIESMARAFIRLAKDNEMTPDSLRAALTPTLIPLPLVEMGLEIYRDYQSALNYRAGVDFDDLIRLALRCLISDPSLVSILRQRWPYILEDEAQDSSQLQQEILSLLAGESGNWVRVGDPNQAIFETFTTASPHYLLDFMQHPDVVPRSLPESGRSTASIINLANHLIAWTRNAHPNPDARSALNLPFIEPTPAGDPQPNPDDCPNCITLNDKMFTPEEEIAWVIQSVESWLVDHPDQTIAILAPSNDRGFKFVDALRNRQIPFVDSLLRSTSSTRLSTSAIYHILDYLGDPRASRKLATAYQVWRRAAREDEQVWPFHKSVSDLIRKLEKIEAFLWPISEDFEMLSSLELEESPGLLEELESFREVVRRWQEAIFLPVDQLVLTVGQDLFLDSAELALIQKLSSLLSQVSRAHPDWRLPEFTEELKEIATNQRRFLGFSGEDLTFNPDLYPGQVVVSTMHKAKGLEWDAVYLTSVSNYDFPSGEAYDQYQSEKFFVRDRVNLEAELLDQLKALMHAGVPVDAEMGTATQEARQEYIRERLRLLYVGITRARIWLTISTNTGHFHRNVAALPFLELTNYWEQTS